MSARIDHTAEARRILADGEATVGKLREAHGRGDVAAADDHGKKAMGCWAQAQVQATLALVEQQRIANMQTERDELRRVAQGRTDAAAAEMTARANVLTVHIREGLGL